MTDWPHGSGEMARRIRAHDWAATPLGPIGQWPQSQKTAVDLMLASGHAMQLAWGPERVVLYNDAYAPMLGERHPAALGIPFRQAWPDIWEEIEPLVRRVFAGETVRFEDMPLVMTRRGYPEDTWWNFSYSPVRDESGAIAGLLNVTVDATPQHRAELAERERDTANRLLQENEARFRALVTAGANSIYRMSPDWRLMYQLDSQTLATTTAPIEDWVEKYIPQEDLPAVLGAIHKAIRTKSLFEFEHRVRLADGGWGWTLSRAVPLLGPEGEIAEWFGAASDVTARREAAEQLRESQVRYRTLFNAIDVGVMVLEKTPPRADGLRDYRYVAMNPTSQNMFATGDLTGQSLRDNFPDEDEGWYDLYDRAIRTGEVPRFEREARSRGMVLQMYLARVDAPEHQRVMVVMQDVTARKQAEMQLLESKERQSFLLGLSDELRRLTDPSDVQQTAMRLLVEQLGVMRAAYFEVAADQDTFTLSARSEAAGAVPIPDRLRLSDFAADLSEAFRRGRALTLPDTERETVGQAGHAAYRAIGIRAWAAVPLVKNGHLVAIVALHSTTPREWTQAEVQLLEDVAERIWAAVGRARAEAALHAADRRKDEFLAVLGHELRNGLAPTVYNVEIVNRSLGDAAQLKEVSGRIGRQLKHVVRLVDDLLDVARINTGKIELNLELVTARDIVSLAVEACRADVDRKRHRLAVIDETDSELAIHGDRVRLTQVVSNLLSNASKYMDSGGTITVRIAREGDEALIEVSDTGIGIPPAALPQVFDLFTQVRNQQAYSAGGLGIGLSLVRQLAAMHGGRVTAASEGPGRGSTFVVHFPIVVARAAEAIDAAQEADVALPAKALRVLVVDDQHDSADALAQLLRLEGHDTQVAYGGTQALECARARRPDLVLLDLGMPGMDGFEVARRLREEFAGEPSMRIVAVTGWGQEADRQRTRAASFDGHLAKPPSSAELQAVLSAASPSLA